MNKVTIAITGGGTGGHVLAGTSVAEEWIKSEYGRVIFVGAKGGIEETLVTKAGLKLYLLSIGALKGRGLIKKIKTLALIPVAVIQSFIIIFKERPNCVLGVGGYASGPFVLAAKLLSIFFDIKTYILEQNAVSGVTNKILGKIVDEVFTVYPGLEEKFSNTKVTQTGNPVRKQIMSVGDYLLEPFTVFIFGGSQGAQGINRLVCDSLEHLKEHKSHINIIHQTGEMDYARVLESYQNWGGNYKVDKFIYDIECAYSKASLVICRSGSGTLSELAIVGRPAILIPFPFATDNHQEENARIFEKNGAASVVLQNQITAQELAKKILRYKKNPSELIKMANSMKNLGRKDAAEKITSLIYQSQF